MKNEFQGVANEFQGAGNEFKVAKIEFQGPLFYLPTQVAGRVAGSIVAQFTKYFQKKLKSFLRTHKVRDDEKNKISSKNVFKFF